MSHGENTVYPILNELPENLNDVCILDLGCGTGDIVYKIRAYSGFEWVKFSGNPYIIGADKNVDCLVFLKKINLYNELFLFDIDNESIIRLKGNRHIHILLCTETLEHTNRSPEYLEVLKTVADKVIISVPYGFKENITKVDEFKHKSAWYPDDFKSHGYTVKIFKNRPRSNKIIELLEKIYLIIRGQPFRGYSILATYEGI